MEPIEVGAVKDVPGAGGVHDVNSKGRSVEDASVRCGPATIGAECSTTTRGPKERAFSTEAGVSRSPVRAEANPAPHTR